MMSGKRGSVSLLIVMVVLVSLMLASTALAAGGWYDFSSKMTGAREVLGPGDPDGRGTAEFSMNIHKQMVCYHLDVENIDPPTAAHIHVGRSTVSGPVVVPLQPPVDGHVRGCVEGVDKKLIRDMISHPHKYYVNVHNATYPPGAVRAQLRLLAN